MRSISYTSLIISTILLYWCTATAYNRVVKVQQIDMMPLFHKHKCILTHLDIQHEKNPVDDLNIYYSGMKTTNDLPKQLIINDDTKIQDEMFKMLKEKQSKQSNSAQTEDKKVLDKKDKTLEKKILQSKQDIKRRLKTSDDDAFSTSKIYKKVDRKHTPKKNIFDVIE